MNILSSVMSVIFGWQGPSDNNPDGEPRFYANNLVAGGNLQQPSNAALYKNTRAKAAKLDRAAVTAATEPTMSFEDRNVEGSKSGVAGNPASKAQDKIQVPAVGSPTEPKPEPDFEAS